MVAARCSADDVVVTINKLGLQAKVSVASVNGPKSVVIGGAETEVAVVLGELGQESKRLNVSHAFHSPLMMPMVEGYRAVVVSLVESGMLASSGLHVPLVSTVTGGPASADELADPEHWVRQVWSPVLFSDALEVCLSQGQGSEEESAPRVVLEVGPNPVLSRMARPWVAASHVAAWCASLDRQTGVSDIAELRKAAKLLDEHLNCMPEAALGPVDRVFPNRKAFPWQAPPHPLLQRAQVIEDDGVTRHRTVFHEALMDLFKDHVIEGILIMFV